jgi:hypothetical protein
MKEVVSLLLTTTCLAVAGLGIYFFSYKTDDDNDSTQKISRKRTGGSGKKIVEVEEKNHDGYNDYDDEKIDNHDDNSYNHDNNDDDEDDYNEDYVKSMVKSKNVSKKSASKTKKNKNKFTSSKKRYYY